MLPSAPLASPRSLRPIHSAALLEGPSGIALHLHGIDGGLTQVPLTLTALREIAALAAAAAGAQPPSPGG